MNGVTGALDQGVDNDDTPLWASIPTGYFPLPLDDIETGLARAESVLTDIADTGQKPQISRRVVGVPRRPRVLRNPVLRDRPPHLAVGRHDRHVVAGRLVPRAPAIPAWCSTISSRPRQPLERPVLFFEHTRHLPSLRLYGQPEVAEDATSPVYQLEAMVPSADGGQLAVVELSTPFEAHGPEFRAMVVALAASVSFEPPALSSDSSATIGQVLG